MFTLHISIFKEINISQMASSKLDKCFLCSLFGNMEGFQYIKNQFDSQHTCDKRYNCNICDKKHNSNEELQTHKNNSHFAGNDSDVVG